MEINLKLYFSDKGLEKKDEIIESIVKDLKHKDTDISEAYSYYLPYFFNSNSPFTMKNKFDEVRKAISESSIAKKRKDECLKIFKIHSALFSYMNNLQNESAKERLNDKLEFSEATYLSNMEYVKNLILNKDFDSIRNNSQTDEYILANLSALYFALATGRRSFEIFKTVELYKVGKTMYFKGLAKKRDNEEIDFVAFALDDDYHFLKKCLENIRKYYDVESFDNKRFNSSYSESWNKFIRTVLNDKNISYSLIRDMYSNVAIKQLNKDNLDTEIFRKLVLSHQDTMMSATDYYRKTKITE